MKSPVAVMHAVEITFSSWRTLPGRGQKHGLPATGEPGDILSIRIVVFLEKKLNQQRNVFEALGERRNANLDGTQPVKQVFTEAPGEPPPEGPGS